MKERSCSGRSALRAGAGSVMLALFCHGCDRALPPPPESARPVKSLLVTAGDELHVRSFPGKVEASRKAELAFQVPGVLVKLPVKEGQKVGRGELIGQLRQDEFEARLKALQGQLDRARAALRALEAGERPEQQLRLESAVRAAEARLANARAEADRDRRLLANRAVSREEAERSNTAHRIALEEYNAARQALEKGTIAREEDIEAKKAEVRGLEGRVVEASLQLADSTLRAPFDGVIAQRFVEENQNVRAKQPIVKFQDVDEIDVAVDVPETVMIADLRSADFVRLVAEFSAAPGLEFPVQIREIAQRADPATQTFRLRASMKAPPDVTLLPGMTGTVTVNYRRAAILGERVQVPLAAIATTSAGAQIAWVIGADGTVTPRPVKLGSASGGSVEVLDGLTPGDRIAIAGVSRLREGMKVRDLGDALGGGQS